MKTSPRIVLPRRRFLRTLSASVPLAAFGASCRAEQTVPAPPPDPPRTVRDRLWLWGHEAGSHNGQFGIKQTSRITPVEAAVYLGIPNLLLIRYDGRPAFPFDQYAIPFRAMKRVVWSLTGAGGVTSDEERKHVLDLAAKMPNLVGFIMDDFFQNTGQAALSVEDLQNIRKRLTIAGRKRDLWVVLYAHQLGLPLQAHLELCDKITFWTWKAPDLKNLEAHFAAAEKLAPKAGKILGCYLWNYGQSRPMPLDLMKVQCDLGLRWLREGRIEGMIFLASCICDLELETVDWTRKWIAEVGDQAL